jgi:GT2 family glycosyltransferase
MGTMPARDSTPIAWSVVIPTFNRPAALAACLDAIAAQDYPRDRIEVVVVDDGGNADLSGVVSRASARIAIRATRQANAGPGQARNTGVALARHDAIAFTDDDCRPRPDWLRRLAGVLEKDGRVAVGGRAENACPGNLFAAASQTIIDVVHAHFNRDHERAQFCPTNNLALRKDQFLELGGFDPAFRCSEDRDFCDRWITRGWRLVFAPEAVVAHARPMTLGGFCAQHFGYGQGAWRFHQARKRRGHGGVPAEGRFYVRCFGQPFGTLPPGRAVAMGGALLAWQLANTAGFAYEAVRSSGR